MALYYEVWHGNDRGMRLTPHRYRDNRFRMRNGAGDPWIAVEKLQIESYLAQGYILGMSAGSLRERDKLRFDKRPKKTIARAVGNASEARRWEW